MWKLKVAEGNDDPWLVSVNGHIGRQHWEFDSEVGTPEERAQIDKMRREFHVNRFTTKVSADRLIRMQLQKERPKYEKGEGIKLKNNEKISKEALSTTLKRAINYYLTIQAHDGHWPSDSSGPLFFTSPLVIVLHIIGDITTVLSPEHFKEIKRYTYNHQNEDGGWGFYLEGHSTMFGTALNYIALRLLGEDADDEPMSRGRDWVLDHGGLTCIPSWGKFWLTILGVYEWDGCNPMPPELWLLPNIFPIHPGKMLCYCRLVYMPMSYIYGRRFVGPITELIQSLRKELHTQPYHEIDWNMARNSSAKEDLYYPRPLIQDMLSGFLHYFGEPILNSWPLKKLRNKAMKTVMEHLHYEDINSRYICIGNVEKVLCLLACWLEDPNSDAYKKHLARIPDYLWLAEDGMKLQTNGSQLWDGALAIQAILRSGLTEEYALTLRKAHDFVKASQVRDNPSGNFGEMYRHPSKGSWTFSIQDIGWQVSDCTAEGLKVTLLLSQSPSMLVGEKLESQHIYDAVNIILSLQSENGGFSAWEPQRAFRWLEKLNPTELFEDTFIEREYVECTSSAIQALELFSKLYPDHRRNEIERCISKGLSYTEGLKILTALVEALTVCGRKYENSVALRKACEFLLSKQLGDGGWGESYLSCANKGDVDLRPIERGVRLLINSQMEDGDFPQQEITGAFFKNCVLHYANYRNIFPIWALAEFHRLKAGISDPV